MNPNVSRAIFFSGKNESGVFCTYAIGYNKANLFGTFIYTNAQGYADAAGNIAFQPPDAYGNPSAAYGHFKTCSACASYQRSVYW